MSQRQEGLSSTATARMAPALVAQLKSQKSRDDSVPKLGTAIRQYGTDCIVESKGIGLPFSSPNRRDGLHGAAWHNRGIS
jgi:hypothetical protein